MLLSAVEPCGGLTCFSAPLLLNVAESEQQKSLDLVLQTPALGAALKGTKSAVTHARGGKTEKNKASTAARIWTGTLK